MTVGIIGADGFIGKHIGRVFKKHIAITRDNYDFYHRAKFDLLINANGNSKKYWANKNPAEDFKASVESVYKAVTDFRFRKYIHISSMDAESNHIHTIYGYNKFIAEKIVKKYCRDYSIVRLPAVIGMDSQKGVVHDIWNDKTIYLTPQSILMLIDVDEVANSLLSLFMSIDLQELERFYPKLGITVEQIAGILEKDVVFDEQAEYLEHQIYQYNGNPRIFKSSSEYLKNTYHEGME